MRTRRTIAVSVAAAAVTAVTIQFSGISTAAVARPAGLPTRPAGETAAQVGSRLVLDTLAEPTGTPGGGAGSPPGGLTVALSSLEASARPASSATPPVVTPAAPPATAPPATAPPAAAPPAAAPPATAPPAITPTTTPLPPAMEVPTTVPAVLPVTAAGGGGGAPGVWAELRQCESGGNYAIDTGNGYYGAYQFSAATWHGLGYPGLPDDASPAVQDQAAQHLQARSGWGQWPACSRKLGL